MRKTTSFIFARDAQIILLLPRYTNLLFERWIQIHSAIYHRSPYPRQDTDGLLCHLVQGGNQVNIFRQMPHKKKSVGLDLGTAEARLFGPTHRP
jgi:hypothetical protein